MVGTGAIAKDAPRPCADKTRQVDAEQIKELISSEVEHFQQQTPRSLELAQRAVEVLPLAVPSSVFAMSPYPIFMSEGEGAYLTDVDGNHYVDYGNGYGTSVFGHANPIVTEAIQHQAGLGSHFGTASEPATEWAELICRRYRLNWVRFSPSGTEATMDALRLARALTDREKVAKLEGGYHGSHLHALVSTNMEIDAGAGPDSHPVSRPFGKGITQNILDEVVVLPFNDLEAAAEALEGETIAGLIIEPIMFNVGAIFPQDGYLEGLRELCSRTGTQLIFDEVKTGATVAYGGAEELFGVKPDLKTLGKGIGGGLSVGAIGGAAADGYDAITSWDLPHLGTFAGNRLTAAAGLAALRDVLTPQAYRQMEDHRLYLTQGLEAVIDEYHLPAYVVGAGAKSCIVWVDPVGGPLTDFRDYKRRFDASLAQLSWFWLVGRGIWLPAGHDEQTTHSVAHGNIEADRYIEVFRELAEKISA